MLSGTQNKFFHASVKPVKRPHIKTLNSTLKPSNSWCSFFSPGSRSNSILALLKLPAALKYQNLSLKGILLATVLFSYLLITFCSASLDNTDHFLWHPKIDPVLKTLLLFEHIVFRSTRKKLKGSQLIQRGMYMNTMIPKFCCKNINPKFFSQPAKFALDWYQSINTLHMQLSMKYITRDREMEFCFQSSQWECKLYESRTLPSENSTWHDGWPDSWICTPDLAD